MKLTKLAATFALGLTFTAAHAELKLARIFSDHMVLQRNIKLPIWGWSTPGDAVTVTLGAKTAKATTGADGRWQVAFEPLKVGAPLTMTVADAGNTLTVSDILVGEVWLGSGQSNMEFTVYAVPPSGYGTMNMDAEVAAANYPEIRMFVATKRFSETPLPDTLGEWQLTNPTNVKKFSAIGYFFSRELYKKYGVPIGFIDCAYGGAGVQAWMSPESLQQNADYNFLLTAYAKDKADWESTPAEVHQANLAKQIQAWEIAEVKRKAEGSASIAKPSMREPTKSQASPALLFNGMLFPLISYPIKGMLWYQGEGNEGAKLAPLYHGMMESMITDWRTRWNEGQFPFLYVQLAPYLKPSITPPDKSTIGYLREQQTMNLAVPKTCMALTIDIGDSGNIHPKNKQEVGRRLALCAYDVAYGEDVPDAGPTYSGFMVKNGKVTIRFTDTKGGLELRNEGAGFAIAGEDKKWYWAQATIEKDTVVLTSPDVPNPVAVRYAYSDDPTASLFNKSTGLPAGPFRSDNW